MQPTNPPDDRHPSPTRFNNFDIETDADGRPRLLGRGTYGETYLARHRFLESLAAIKVISERFLSQAKAREQFLAEAKAVARLRHPHIAQVHDFGIIDNGLFYAMEFCAGGNLAEWMRTHGGMSPQQLLAVAQQATSALKCCHAAGFIHRDLKPANLMLASASGPLVVKLIDFGLVQTGPQSSGDASQHIGTPLYASPEQLKEQDVDARSDLFSLGMTLWHLATAQPPDAGTAAEIIGSRLSPASYAGRLPAALSAPLRSVIERLVEKDLARRPASAAQALDALNDAALAMGAPIFTDLVHAPEAGAARPSEAADAPPVEIEHFERNLEADFGMTQVLGDSASGRTYLAVSSAPGAAPAVIHVLDSKVCANPVLIDRVRQHVGRLAALKLPAVLAIRGMRSYGDFTAVVLDAPPGSDLLAALKVRGKVPVADARPLLETIASTCDRLTAAGLPGIELGAGQIFLPSAAGASWQPVLVPRFLALRDRAEAGESFMLDDSDAAATMTPDTLTETSADNLPGLFARLLYRVTAGRDSPAAASLSMQGYVAIPELSEESNRTLAQVIGKVIGYNGCGPLLGRVLSLEGMGGATATRTHSKTGTRSATAGTHTGFPRTATAGTQTVGRTAPVTPLATEPAAPPRRKMGAMLAVLAILSIAGTGGAVWWKNQPPTPPNPGSDARPGGALAIPAAAGRLAAGEIVRLKSDSLLGAAKFTVLDGPELAATRTAEGWEIRIPDGGLALPVKIVGEVAGFSPENLPAIEGRGELRKPIAFAPKKRMGKLTFNATQGCDYEEIVAKKTKTPGGAPVSVAEIARHSFPITAPGAASGELDPGFYQFTLYSAENGARPLRDGDVEVRAGSESAFDLPPSWVGTYSAELDAAGSAVAAPEKLTCKLTVTPGLGGRFDIAGRRWWCNFAKGNLDARGNFNFRLPWAGSEDELGARFDWTLTATRQADGTLRIEASESLKKNVHEEENLERQLGRAPFTKKEWSASGALRAARK